MLIALAVIIIAALLLYIMKQSGSKKETRETTGETTKVDVIENEKYYKKDILTDAELSFFQVCRLAIQENDIYIFPKMTLKEMLYVVDENGRKNGYKYFSKIDKKHIDFTLIDSKTNNIICCIELDDSSHKREDRMKRDEYVNAVMEMAGIKLVRIPAKKGYTLDEIKSKLNI